MVDARSEDGVTAGIPSSLYRLQFRKEFPLGEAIKLTGSYLEKLGADGIYASPLARSRPGSGHGYDGTDPNEIDPDRGGIDDLLKLSDALHGKGMKLVLDWVPNHMAASYDNKWWRDVLTLGQDSKYSKFFDINWNKYGGKVLLPVLGDHFGEIMEKGELKLGLNGDNEFTINYWDNKFPVSPTVWKEIFEQGNPEQTGWQSTPVKPLLDACSTMSGAAKQDASAKILHVLSGLYEHDPAFRGEVDRKIEWFNDPANIGHLESLIQQQPYQLAFWEAGFGAINYRRFFDINELAGLRQEDPEVFAEAHELVTSLIREGKADGLRIDHPDGLRDPAAYFEDLQTAIRKATGNETEFPVWIEKIVEGDEKLRANWPVAGDTGYPFLNQVSGLFVDPISEKSLTDFYKEVSDSHESYDEILINAKKHIIFNQFRQEVELLSDMLLSIAKQDRKTADYTPYHIKNAIEGMMIGMPVYRTYIRPGEPVSPEDAAILEKAANNAKSLRDPPPNGKPIDFLRSVLDGSIADRKSRDGKPAYDVQAIAEFVRRFQQYTGPIMAKSKEDTAYYRYFRLTSLNEVGGEPAHWGNSVTAFHDANLRRREHEPYTMLDTTTHDTKRSEDARMRINVLSQMPRLWTAHVRMWQENNRDLKDTITLPDDQTITAPSGRWEYLIYQTLAGTWPQGLNQQGSPETDDYKNRIKGYLRKSISEAKDRDSWVVSEPHHNAYEKAFDNFVDRLFEDRQFFTTMVDFQEKVAHAARAQSLSQLMLKMTSPGIPVVYQGTELWDDSLVDPDNRRPVDYGRREALLSAWEQTPPALADLRRNWQAGDIKLFTLQQELKERQAHPDLYTTGLYVPLTEVEHADPAKIVAFARENDERTAIIIAPRLIAPEMNQREPLDVSQAFREDASLITALPQGTKLENIFTHEEMTVGEAGRIHLKDVFEKFPVAHLVVKEEARPESALPPGWRTQPEPGY